jgi:hypothetical protein
MMERNGTMNVCVKLLSRFLSHPWWHTPIMPALGRQRQEDWEFEASLSSQKMKKEKERLLCRPFVPGSFLTRMRSVFKSDLD